MFKLKKCYLLTIILFCSLILVVSYARATESDGPDLKPIFLEVNNLSRKTTEKWENGDTIEIEIKIKNIGNIKTEQSSYSVAWHVNEIVEETPAIEPQEIYAAKHQIIWNEKINGDYSFVVKADYNNKISELDEINLSDGQTNNELTKIVNTGGTAIAELSPLSGTSGAKVSIIGKNLGEDCSGRGTFLCVMSVSFEGVALSDKDIVLWNNNKIEIIVPVNAKTGNVKVSYKNHPTDNYRDGAFNEEYNITGPVFTIAHNNFSCSDTDNGKDYYSKGHLDGNLRNLSYFPTAKTREDYCIDGATLNEFYCQENYLTSYHYKCPDGCNDGACVKSDKKPDLIIKNIEFGEVEEMYGEKNITKKVIFADVCNIGDADAIAPEGSIMTEISIDNNKISFGHGANKILIDKCEKARFVITKDGKGYYGSNSIKVKDGDNVVTVTADSESKPDYILPEYWRDSYSNNVIKESNEDNNSLTKIITINFDTAIEPTVSDSQITKINTIAKLLDKNAFDQILAEIKELRDIVKEQSNEIKYLKGLTKDLSNITQKATNAINNFITYGVDENTKKLGAGERAAVMYSYKSAFDKLPETEEELADAIKIANGRWPSITNETAEKMAKEQFQKIYKRIPNMEDAKDNAAVTVMAYGLRQRAENRNLESEKKGIAIFKGIYKKLPETTEEWNTMQAITYSGATR